MDRLRTLTGRQFQYKGTSDGEIIVYPSDKDGNPQSRSAIVITPHTVRLVKRAIKKATTIKMGASRDRPPTGSLGALLKEQKQSPQQLSYLIPILVDEGFCSASRPERAFLVVYRGAGDA